MYPHKIKSEEDVNEVFERVMRNYSGMVCKKCGVGFDEWSNWIRVGENGLDGPYCDMCYDTLRPSKIKEES